MSPSGQDGTTEPDFSKREGGSIGPYKLLEKIGEGGFGEVWLAEQKEPVKRRVAVKIIKLGMDTRQVVARFEAERQALALMDHPNIAKVFDGGATELGRPFFVMELVKGIAITEYCKTNNIGTEERLRLFIQVCQAIQHAHQKGIIHRDIKPSNILVSMQDGVAVPKVIDFGIAKATQQPLTDKTLFTQLQQFIGTPAYMSPEQAEMTGIDIDTRSDIYSLGVLLYELLTGATPFDSKELLSAGLDEMRRIIREQDPVRPSTRLSKSSAEITAKSSAELLIKALRGDLDWIVMKCLEKDRARRYETANGLAIDIQRYLAGEPIAARPPSRVYRFKKLALKYKTATAAALGVFLCVSLAAIISTVSLVSEREARRTLKSQKDASEAARKQAEEQRSLAQLSFVAAKQSEDRARQALYGADMLLVEQAVSVGNLGHAQDLLNKYIPRNDSERDLRGWEWRYYRDQTRSDELFTLGALGEMHICTGITVLPNGRLAVLSERGLIQLYDVFSRRLLKSAQLNYTGVILDPDLTRFIVSPDGRYLFVSSRKELFILETESLSLLQKRTFPKSIEALDANDDSTELLVNSGLALAQLKLPDCSLLDSKPIPFSYRVILSPDRKAAFLHRSEPWSPNQQEEFWDLKRHVALEVGLTNFATRTVGAHFSPNGKWCVESSDIVLIRDGKTGEELQRLTAFRGWVISAAWSPDSSLLALGSADQTISVYRTDSWQRLALLQGHRNEVTALGFSTEGAHIYSADKSGMVKVWSAKTFATALQELPWSWQPFKSRFAAVYGALAAGASIAVAREDAASVAVLYKLPSLKMMGRISVSADTILLSDDGEELLTVEADRIRLRKAADGRLLHEYHLPQSDVTAVALAANNSILAASSGDHVYLWRADKNAPVGSALLPPKSYTAEELRFSPDAEQIAAISGDSILLLGVRNLAVAHVLRGHFTLIAAVAYSPDGKLLASASWDATVRVWDTRAGLLLQTLRGEQFGQSSVAFSRDGSRLAAGGGFGTIRLWETRGWQQVALLRHGTKGVRSIGFGAGDRYLASMTEVSCKIFNAPQE